MGRNEFDAGNIHYKGHWKGWALKNETFLVPENGNEGSERHLGPKIRMIRISGAESGSVSVVFSLSCREMPILRWKSLRLILTKSNTSVSCLVTNVDLTHILDFLVL